MVNTSAQATKTAHPFGPARVARDYAYIMPGFFIALFSFVILVPLTALSFGTLVVWIGVLLLPLTLSIASGFAELSRARLRHWGLDLPPTHYAPAGPGITGFMRVMLDPRRWLDLVFETVIALPLRIFTFVVATVWSAIPLGGLTFLIWGVFLPDRGVMSASGQSIPLPGLILEALTDGAVPDRISHSFTLEVVFNLAVGIVFLLTLPFVLRGLAWLDAAAASAALAGSPAAIPTNAQGPGRAHEFSRPPINIDRFASGEGWAWITTGFVAIVMVAVSWPLLATLYGMHPALAMLLAFASAAALLLVIRRPVVGIALQTLAVIATTLFPTSVAPTAPWPWPVHLLILQAVLVLIVALRNPWQLAVAAWALPQVAMFALTFRSSGLVASVIVSAAVSLGLAVLGGVIRGWMGSRGALREERRTSADLSAQREELAERNRIAQELHDVVAHSMSVISVQATTAKYRLPGTDPDADQEFQSIAESSRQALTEMRSLLAVLRAPDGDAPLAPQPTLDDIPSLVEATRRSGASIAFRSLPADDDTTAPVAASEPASDSVPASTGLTAYRIVQEALSNAVRHAPGAEIEVTVEVAADRVSVEVANGPAAGPGPHQAAPGAGLGLAGVRERTAALGGTVEAGPTEPGGFRVHASLPLD